MSYTDKFGVRFSDDGKTLESCPKDFQGKYEIPYGVTDIGVDTISLDFNLDKLLRFNLDDSNNSTFNLFDYLDNEDENTFSNCSGLTEVIIPNSVEKIAECAFQGCSSLKNISLPNSVREIGEFAFSECTALSEIHLSNNLIQIHLDAFNDCPSLKEITIPRGVDIITSAPQECLYIEKVYCSQLFQAIIAWDIPSVKKIFMSNSMMCMTITRNNWYLKEINLPKDFHPDLDHRACGGASLIQNYLDDYFHFLDYDPVIRIDFNCQPLDKIVVSPQNPYVDSREDSNAIIDTKTNTLLLGCHNTIIPNGITAIASYAFQDCRKLKTIRIPDSIVAIGDYALSGCYNLTEIRLPNSITSIGEKVFPHCKSFKKIIIPKGSRQRFIKIGLKEYSDLLVEE